MVNSNKKKKVIGVILAYKHASFLADLYNSLPKDILDDVFVSNDESGDGIELIAESLGIKCFSHPRLGYGGNMKYGIGKAIELGADYIVEIHGDGQFDTAFIKPAVEKIKEGYGLVLGSRFMDMKQPLRDKMPLSKYFANIGLTSIESLVLSVDVSEFHTGARVYSREVFGAMDLARTSNDFLFGFEIIAMIAYLNFKIGEVPVRCYYANDHTSISIKHSSVYAIGTFIVLGKYVMARMGFENNLFHKKYI